MLRLPTENTLDREETIMAEWLKTALIDIVELIGGGTPKTSKAEYWGGNINWLSVKDFNNENRYVYSTEKTITEEGLNNSSTKLLKKDDIIISARGTVGELAMIPFPMAFNQSCYGIRAKEGIKEHFTVDWYKRNPILSKINMSITGYYFKKCQSRDAAKQKAEQIVTLLNQMVKDFITATDERGE